MFGLKAIKIPHGFDPTWNSTALYDPTFSIKKWNGVVFHKPMKLYDEFFNDFYIEANGGKSDEKFNIEVLLNYEASIAKELIQHTIPYKMTGIIIIVIIITSLFLFHYFIIIFINGRYS